jgi:DNA-binding beta-propeller fold protein YncE
MLLSQFRPGLIRSAVLASALALALGLAMVDHANAAHPDGGTMNEHTEGTYAVLQTYPVGGGGGWDYLTLDSSGARLFVARRDRVQVFDTATGALAGEIPATAGVHGVLLLPGLGLTSNGADNTLTVFDPGSLEVHDRIPSGGDGPDYITRDPASGLVLVFHGRSHEATLIDPATHKVAGRIELDGKPEAAVADGKGHLWVAIEDRNEIQVLDLASRKATARWKVEGCDEAVAVAADLQRRHVFLACHGGTLHVLDAADGHEQQRLSIGEGVDAAAYDPGRRLLFTAQADGTLAVVGDAPADAGFALLQTVKTMPGARTLARDDAHDRIYLVSAKIGPVPEKGGRPDVLPGSFRLIVVGPAVRPDAQKSPTEFPAQRPSKQSTGFSERAQNP